MSSTLDASMTVQAATPVLEVRGVKKGFPGVVALNGVHLSIWPGEVHALCGENGAGKSTLMKILAGSITAEEGEMFHHGQEFAPRHPLDAKRRGIVLVHQEISLVPDLTVAENLFLGELPRRRGGWVNRDLLLINAQRVLRECRFDIDPLALVGALPLARQQMVEIARACALPCSVVIFDEPTAALTDAEAESLFVNIRRLTSQGVAVIYISHKMKEIFRLSDRVTVLRDGETRGTLHTRQTSEDELLRLMIGRSLDGYFHRATPRYGNELLAARHITVPGFVEDISFTVRQGEILGLYGLVGAGRSELVEAIFGVRARSAGTLHWSGREVDIRSPSDAVALGIGLVPEDRKKQGLVLGLGGRDNMGLPSLSRLSRLGFMRGKEEQASYARFRQSLNIKVSGPTVALKTLSGGNQQKFVLAKWLATNPQLLILDEPTRGIDVGAKAEIHKYISELALSGMAVVLISSEMPEIMGVSHRILTMYNGKLTGEFDAEAVTEELLIDAVMHA